MMDRMWTRETLAALFRRCGLRPASTVMVHSSLKALGHVVNGSHDVIDALLDVIGPQGTLVMPSYSGQLTDPADWCAPPVPPSWVDDIRRNMAPFDPQRTPPRNLGRLVETFLTYPGVLRSLHPIGSVAALGAQAAAIVKDHPIDEITGMAGPFGVLYGLEADVLMMGVGLESCTALHLAEFIADIPRLKDRHIRVLIGPNTFYTLKKYPGTSLHFERIRQTLKDKSFISETKLDNYLISTMDMKKSIDVATELLLNSSSYFD